MNLSKFLPKLLLHIIIPTSFLNRYIALVSGFDIGSGHDSLLAMQEMVFTLMGKTGIPELQKMMSQVARLIIAGNRHNRIQ